MDELDIYRCAKLLLDQHGRDAELHAAMRADALDAAGAASATSARAVGAMSSVPKTSAPATRYPVNALRMGRLPFVAAQ